MKSVVSVYSLLSLTHSYYSESKSIDYITNRNIQKFAVSLGKLKGPLKYTSERIANDIANRHYSELYLILFIGKHFIDSEKKLKPSDYKSDELKQLVSELSPESVRNATTNLAEIFNATGLNVTKLTELNATGTSFLVKMYKDNKLPLSSIMYLVYHNMIKPINCETHNKILTTVTKMIDMIKYYKQGESDER